MDELKNKIEQRLKEFDACNINVSIPGKVMHFPLPDGSTLTDDVLSGQVSLDYGISDIDYMGLGMHNLHLKLLFTDLTIIDRIKSYIILADELFTKVSSDPRNSIGAHSTEFNIVYPEYGPFKHTTSYLTLLSPPSIPSEDIEKFICFIKENESENLK